MHSIFTLKHGEFTVVYAFMQINKKFFCFVPISSKEKGIGRFYIKIQIETYHQAYPGIER